MASIIVCLFKTTKKEESKNIITKTQIKKYSEKYKTLSQNKNKQNTNPKEYMGCMFFVSKEEYNSCIPKILNVNMVNFSTIPPNKKAIINGSKTKTPFNLSFKKTTPYLFSC